MRSTEDIKTIYTGIQYQLSNLIPEEWESIYLYASVVKQLNNLETWEMYFYYVPQGILKKNPVNVYEVPNKFNVDEEEYLQLVDSLCNTIRVLHKEYKNTYEKEWSNMVIAIKDSQFLIEYNDDNLLKSKYKSEDRHAIFRYKYLNIPLQSFSKEDRKVILSYIHDDEFKMVYDRYFEHMPKKQVHNCIEYEKENGYTDDEYSMQLMAIEEKKPSLLRLLINLLKRRHRKSTKRLMEPSMGSMFEQKFENKIQILNEKM